MVRRTAVAARGGKGGRAFTTWLLTGARPPGFAQRSNQHACGDWLRQSGAEAMPCRYMQKHRGVPEPLSRMQPQLHQWS